MKFVDRGSIFNVRGTNMTVSEIISILKKVPSYEIVELFGKNNKLLPRTARMKVLKNLLNDDVQKTKIRGVNLSDEINYRLNWYNNYSEYQLCELIPLFSSWDESLEEYYLEDIWIMLLQVANEMGVSDEDLFDLIVKTSKAPNVPLETSRDFNKGLDPLFCDYSGCLDGINIGTFRECLINSSTLVELREIGKKFNIDVPRRIKKEQLVEIIIDNMEKTETLDKEGLRAELMEKSVIQLQRFAKDHNIKASVELKKEDIIEYIISNLEIDNDKVARLIQLPEINITPRFLLVDASKKYIVESEEEILEEVVEEAPVEIIETKEEEVKEETVEETVEEVKEEVKEEVIEEKNEEVTSSVISSTINNEEIKSLTEAINGLKLELSKLLNSIEIVEEEETEDEEEPSDNQEVIEELVKIQEQVTEVNDKIAKKEEVVEEDLSELKPLEVEAFKNSSSKKLTEQEESTRIATETNIDNNAANEYCRRELKFQEEFNKAYAKHPVRAFFKVLLWILYYIIVIALVLAVACLGYYFVITLGKLEEPSSGILKTIFDFISKLLN